MSEPNGNGKSQTILKALIGVLGTVAGFLAVAVWQLHAESATLSANIANLEKAEQARSLQIVDRYTGTQAREDLGYIRGKLGELDRRIGILEDRASRH